MSDTENVLLRFEAYLADRPVASVGAMVQDARSEILRLRAENEKLRERLEKAHSFISRADWIQFFEEEHGGNND